MVLYTIPQWSPRKSFHLITISDLLCKHRHNTISPGKLPYNISKVKVPVLAPALPVYLCLRIYHFCQYTKLTKKFLSTIEYMGISAHCDLLWVISEKLSGLPGQPQGCGRSTKALNNSHSRALKQCFLVQLANTPRLKGWGFLLFFFYRITQIRLFSNS